MAVEAWILIVDDEWDSRVCVQEILETAGFGVHVAANGLEALEILDARPVDLILADIAMPRMNGYELFEAVTSDPRWVSLPFVFVTGRSLDSDVRYGKLMGVDDYITKPFRALDLVTTVRGRLRRAQQLGRTRTEVPGASDTELVIGDLSIDPATFGVRLGEREIQLSSREFELLYCLAENYGRVVPIEDLVQETHDVDVAYVDIGGLIRPLIRSLRRKLGFGPGDWGFIRNIRGVGYQLVEPRIEEAEDGESPAA